MMDFQLIDVELSESRLYRASRKFGAFTGKEIANLLYLDTMMVYMLSRDTETAEFARDYAKKSVQYGTYSLFRTHAPDMYMLAYQIMHPSNDYANLKDAEESKRFLSGLSFHKLMHQNFIRKLVQVKLPRSEAITYLYRLEKQLNVTDARYRGWRRLVGDWENLKYSSKQRVVAHVMQELRRMGAGSGRYLEVSDQLMNMLKYTKYKNIADKPAPEPAKKSKSKGIKSVADYWSTRRAI